MAFDAAAHWQRAYAERSTDELSWTERSPATSMELIGEAGLEKDAAIIDVGGGASTLAAELNLAGYTDLTVADISAKAMETARSQLGERSARIEWVQADVRDHDFGRRFDLWHDRAVFHFMVDAPDRDGYLSVLRRSLRADGHLILATFGPDGPTECSGLPVSRYDTQSLTEALGGGFQIITSRVRDHRTPSGRSQQFLHAHLRRTGT